MFVVALPLHVLERKSVFLHFDRLSACLLFVICSVPPASVFSLTLHPCPPAPTYMIAYPCGVCKKAVGINHKAIQCSLCELWVHIRCNLLDKNDYAYYQDVNNDQEDFFCINCLADSIPLSNLNSTEFSISVKKGVINSEEKNAKLFTNLKLLRGFKTSLRSARR